MRFTTGPALPLGLGALALLSLAACGGGDDPAPGGLPQLAAASPATLSGSCEALATALAGQANTTIASAATVAAGTLTAGGSTTVAAGAPTVGEHCLVKGSMFEGRVGRDGKTYAIGFEMRLPKAWNGRFYYQANGGLDGNVNTAAGALGGGPLTGALAQGFAVISSDAGHKAADGSTFGLDPQARLDYGYQAVAKLTPMAKESIRRAYGKAPDRSYFGGCSNGGRHAFVAAARYADQYDGILAGAPGYNLPKAAVASIWGAQRYATVATGDVTTPAGLATAFTEAERRLVSSKIVERCDALDGARDGMVTDTAACQSAFNLARDVPSCGTAGRDGTCLTDAQKSVVASIFAGATTSTGAMVYASFPWDPGISGGLNPSATSATGSGIGQWEFFAPLVLDSGSVGQVFSVPPQPLGFNGPAFALTTSVDTLVAGINATDATFTESAMSFMTPPNPTNLATLKSRGAKMMVYHGVSDPIFSINDTVAWYDGLRASNGGDASNFAKLYPVPGMGHCSGGPATDQFDMLTPLVKWVEQGQAPQAVVASARGAGNVGGVNADLPATWAANRTRPLCPYPQVARYKGTGSLESADSFSCQ